MEEYEKLLNDLRAGEVGNKLLNDPDWQIIKKIAAGIANVANMSLRKIDPEDKTGIIRLQQKIEFYEGFVKDLAENLYRDGAEAYAIAQDLGITPYLFRQEEEKEF